MSTNRQYTTTEANKFMTTIAHKNHGLVHNTKIRRWNYEANRCIESFKYVTDQEERVLIVMSSFSGRTKLWSIDRKSLSATVFVDIKSDLTPDEEWPTLKKAIRDCSDCIKGMRFPPYELCDTHFKMRLTELGIKQEEND